MDVQSVSHLREERHFGMLRLVVKYMDANVSEEPVGSNFGSQYWQRIPSTNLHGLTTQKTVILILPWQSRISRARRTHVDKVV